MIHNNVICEIKKRGAEISDDIICWRRKLHQIPELRMETPKTEAQIVEILRDIGVADIRTGVGGHGVCATLKGAFPGKCLAIRADCDGLPIKEQTGLEFASTNGNMHACGHDAHTAMALGAAKLLVENASYLKGSVKLIFQPYEEGDGGARSMIADGVLTNPDVDAIIALHNHCTPDESYIPGDVLVTREPTSANIFSYEAVFHGEQAHVCLSHTAKNSVYMACEAVTEINRLQKQAGLVNAVTVINGGVRNNVIPETCTVAGSVRSFDSELHKAELELLYNILHKAAWNHGGSVEINKTIDLMSTKISDRVYDAFCKAMNLAYPDRGFVELKNREMIGEDFARYADRIPALYFMLHTKPEGECHPLHHPKFDVNESVLHKGSTVFALFALMWQDLI